MTPADVSRQLTDLVKSIDGVVQVYDARPTALAAAADLVATVTGQPVGEPIAVNNSEGGVSVAVSVAITDASPAADVCRRILDAIAAHLGSDTVGETVDRVKIQVSRVSAGEGTNENRA
ncbi:MAG: hypothetical protein ABIX44_01220 [Cryobacterium sp.]